MPLKPDVDGTCTGSLLKPDARACIFETSQREGLYWGNVLYKYVQYVFVK